MSNDRRDERIATKPEDWAPPARVHLFGLGSLSPSEFAIEGTRMSGGRPKYGETVFDAAIAEQRRQRMTR